MLSLEFETVDVQLDRGVGWITLNRPAALNAWTRPLGEELGAALEQLGGDSDTRAIVLTGAGRAFSAGADLKASEVANGPAANVLTVLREVYNPLLLSVRTLPKPVIAAVNGAAAGIGCSLALAADLIVAAQSSYFLLAFANIGLGLDGGTSTLLQARIGHARASEMALLADRIPAEQALAWGLVNRVVPDGELRAAAADLASRLAAGPPGAYATIKHSLNQAAYRDFAEMLELEAVLQQERAGSADFAEGVAAFVQKRPPRFTGA